MLDKEFCIKATAQYIQVPRKILSNLDRMTSAEVKCYIQICADMDSNMDIKTLANRLGMTEPELKRAIESLADKGMLEIDKNNLKITANEDTVSDHKKLKSTDNVTAMLQTIEEIKGSQLPRNMINTIFEIQDRCSYDSEMMIYLSKYCIERGKFLPNYIRTVADAWKEKGIDSAEQAELNNTSKYDKTTYRVLKALGRGDGQPTDTEANMISTWSKQHGIDEDTILKVCEFTTLRTTPGKRLLYADKVMEKNGWDIEKIMHSIETKRQSPTKSNKFTQFEQNDTDYNKLEQMLLDN